MLKPWSCWFSSGFPAPLSFPFELWSNVICWNGSNGASNETWGFHFKPSCFISQSISTAKEFVMNVFHFECSKFIRLRVTHFALPSHFLPLLFSLLSPDSDHLCVAHTSLERESEPEKDSGRLHDPTWSIAAVSMSFLLSAQSWLWLVDHLRATWKCQHYSCFSVHVVSVVRGGSEEQDDTFQTRVSVILQCI